MTLRKGVATVAAGVFAFLLCARAYAQVPPGSKFHEPGNLICSQCHTVHYSEDGTKPALAESGGPFKALLLYDCATDLCLSCHDTAGANATFAWNGSVPPKVKGTVANELPAGNFSYSYADGHKGHNPDEGDTEPTLIVAPGGTYPKTSLMCTSCHGPHGATSGVTPGYSFEYRNLKTKPGGITTALTLNEVGSLDANEATLTTPGSAADQNAVIDGSNHNVYKGEFGKWCGSCHSNPDNAGTGFHGGEKTDLDVSGDGLKWYRHPTNTNLGSKHATNYGSTTSFAYPIITTSATAATTAEWSLVASESKVFCLSCHQAHATNNPNALRWDPSSGSGGVTGPGGRQKCGKCHGR